MIRIIPLLLACLLAPSGASAAEWARIYSPAEGNQFFYDKAKLFIHDNEITYWKKVVFLTPQPFKDKLAASGLYRERINCAEHTLKLISYLLYAPSGEPVEYVSSAEGEAAPIIPDSLGDVFEKSLCPLVRQKHEEDRQKAEAKAKTEAAEKAAAEAKAKLEAEAAAAAKIPQTKPAQPAAAAPQPAAPLPGTSAPQH